MFNNIENLKVYDKVKEQDVSKVFYAEESEYWFWRERDTTSQFRIEYILLEPRQIAIKKYTSHSTLRY